MGGDRVDLDDRFGEQNVDTLDALTVALDEQFRNSADSSSANRMHSTGTAAEPNKTAAVHAMSR